MDTTSPNYGEDCPIGKVAPSRIGESGFQFPPPARSPGPGLPVHPAVPTPPAVTNPSQGVHVYRRWLVGNAQAGHRLLTSNPHPNTSFSPTMPGGNSVHLGSNQGTPRGAEVSKPVITTRSVPKNPAFWTCDYTRVVLSSETPSSPRPRLPGRNRNVLAGQPSLQKRLRSIFTSTTSKGGFQ